MTVNVYEQYFEGDLVANGVERRAVLVMLIADSEAGRIRYEAAAVFFPHRDETDFAPPSSPIGTRRISPFPTTPGTAPSSSTRPAAGPGSGRRSSSWIFGTPSTAWPGKRAGSSVGIGPCGRPAEAEGILVLTIRRGWYTV